MESFIKNITEKEKVPDLFAPKEGQHDANDVDNDLRKIIENMQAKILVIGVGGAGNNAITRLNESGIVGAVTLAANTDAQQLLYSKSHKKLLLGRELCRGLGAGNDPQIGAEAAMESSETLKGILSQVDMCFIVCGLGGGTGTGAAPVIARIAKNLEVLTVSICTLPFEVEGRTKLQHAKEGLRRLYESSDTTIVVPNEKLIEIAPELSLKEAFLVADEILIRAVRGVTEIINRPGDVNVDFADVQRVLGEGGAAIIGLGESSSPDNRAREAVEDALKNPLLEVDIRSAKSVLLNITGGPDLKLNQTEEVIRAVTDSLSNDIVVKFGVLIDPKLEGTIRATIIVSGVRSPYIISNIQEDALGMDVLLEEDLDLGLETFE
ncbi:cell division protein FtsZ [Candidatus Heimdallarchaeota archaeon]|nr:MAG: cell division protein FtsZ [Candidatus Gerdarchaeota archaeon]RLI70985.1 MAG: cell division protein FtsZ [Candidatus Gerdarchaeota archaeon]RLI73395.1 MAG: cell division protein FtsZ [Candidatus Heimdallarchaeota archaeon]